MTKIVEENWQKVFLNDIKTKLSHADIGYKNYKKTGHIIYLQQASNKLFSAVENYLMLKYKKRVSSYVQLRLLLQNNRDDRVFLSHTVQLHYFFYNAELQMSKEEAEDLYVEIYNKMKSRVRGKLQ